MSKRILPVLSSVVYLLLIINIFFYTSDSYSQDFQYSKVIKEIQRGDNDSIRFAFNDIFSNQVKLLLLQPNSFQMNFDSLKNISIVSSDDKKIRLYTWLVPHYDGLKYTYFGFLQLHSQNEDSLITLSDSTEEIIKPESEKLNPSRWLGALYYSVLTVKNGRNVYYTLLGWKAFDKNATKKVLDVLYISPTGTVFGFPLFKTGSVFKNRMIFTFPAQSTMTLRYDEKLKGITFDNLQQGKNNSDILSGASGSYNLFKLKKGRWVLFKDVDARGMETQEPKLPEPPEIKN